MGQDAGSLCRSPVSGLRPPTAMQSLFQLLRPILLFALGVGLGKAFWVLVGQPALLIQIHSLTAVEFGGALYLTFRVSRHSHLGILQLWLGNMILFAFCQGILLVGMLHSWLTGNSTAFHDPELLRTMLGYVPEVGGHALLHVVNWMIIAPTVVTWVSGAPILYLRRRLASLHPGEHEISRQDAKAAKGAERVHAETQRRREAEEGRESRKLQKL